MSSCFALPHQLVGFLVLKCWHVWHWSTVVSVLWELVCCHSFYLPPNSVDQSSHHNPSRSQYSIFYPGEMNGWVDLSLLVQISCLRIFRDEERAVAWTQTREISSSRSIMSRARCHCATYISLKLRYIFRWFLSLPVVFLWALFKITNHFFCSTRH